MKQFNRLIIGTLAAATFAGTAQAENAGKARFSFGASSLGATAEVAYRIHENISVRGFAAGLVKLSPTVALDGTDFDTTVEPQGYGALIDWHPGLGGLRVSGGAVYADPTFSASTTASAANPITVGNTTLTSGEIVSADINFANKVSPMVSMGWDQPIGDRWVLSGEIGALFNGGYTADVAVSGGALPPGEIGLENSTIEDQLNVLKVYPYVGIMMGFRF